MQTDQRTTQAIVKNASAQDAGRGVARMDPASLSAIGARVGDYVAICVGDAIAYGRALPTHHQDRGKGLVLLDERLRANAKAEIGSEVQVQKAQIAKAVSMSLRFDHLDPASSDLAEAQLKERLTTLPIAKGDIVQFESPDGKIIDGLVVQTHPECAVLLTHETNIDFQFDDSLESLAQADAILGLGSELESVLEYVDPNKADNFFSPELKRPKPDPAKESASKPEPEPEPEPDLAQEAAAEAEPDFAQEAALEPETNLEQEPEPEPEPEPDLAQEAATSTPISDFEEDEDEDEDEDDFETEYDDSVYGQLGGLGDELGRIREMIELPLLRPDLFEDLGIDPPKGVLLSGPPGTGKTLLARSIAEHCDTSFFQISGPEIMGKHYGESEKYLRDVFKQAEARGQAIVFIDEIDAIAPKRENLAGDKQVERRIVAQLLTLMDGIKGRGQIIVIGATNLPDAIDPALRRPGRFDRELSIGVPNRIGRREILEIHTQGMPLADDVDLNAIADATHGYVGADLAALCREAGMAILRRNTVWENDAPTIADDGEMEVDAKAFSQALSETNPSALREVFSEVPNVTWAQIAGLEDVKTYLTEAIVWPLRYPDTFSRFALKPSKGVLLQGPPGTGKTLIAKALANEAGVNFISVRGPQILNQYVGESEKAIREIFAKARLAAPTILFFDEIDSIAPIRGTGDTAVLERVVAQFLTELDGVQDLNGVFLLAATNRADRIDPALLRPGRFDAIMDVPTPDSATREAILNIHSCNIPLAPDVDLRAIAEDTHDFVGADLASLIRLAAQCALRRSIETNNPEELLAQTDLEAALMQSQRNFSARQISSL